MNELKNYIACAIFKQCLLEIEEKLDWGSSENWNTQDFERLSDRIATETDVMLSSTTLKRLWGKVKYDSTPNISTLNTLAKFIGVEDWRIYERENQQKEVVALSKKRIGKSKPKQKEFDWKWVIGVSFLFLIIAWYAFRQSTTITSLNPSEFSFQSRRVAQGLPNSVVFEYDASSAKETDKIEIQQSWDESKRVEVSSEDRVSTSIYYKPGYFNAKLLVNNQVMKTHDIFIPTDGWLGLAEQQPVPLYFEQNDIQEQDVLRISSDLLAENAINPNLHDAWVSFYRVEDFGDLRVDNFTMETTLKNEFGRGASACQKARIILICSGEVIAIPLSIPGCVAENNLFMLGNFISGRKEDLSAFGYDFSDWAKVKCVSKNGKISFFVNDQLAYQMTMPKEKKNKIMGIRYRFQGTGAVKDLKFEKDGQLVFSK